MSEAREPMMPPASVLQLRHGEPDVHASAATYAEAIARQGLPETHSQLLRDLKAWVATDAELSHSPLAAMQRVLEVEGDILMDAVVAGTAAEHVPFLYMVVGEVFAERGAPSCRPCDGKRSKPSTPSRRPFISIISTCRGPAAIVWKRSMPWKMWRCSACKSVRSVSDCWWRACSGQSLNLYHRGRNPRREA
jgi:hypothetical protein